MWYKWITWTWLLFFIVIIPKPLLAQSSHGSQDLLNICACLSVFDHQVVLETILLDSFNSPRHYRMARTDSDFLLIPLNHASCTSSLTYKHVMYGPVSSKSSEDEVQMKTFYCLVVHVIVSLCMLCTCCSTALWDSSVICGCSATQVTTRQCGHTSSHIEDRLGDAMSHPESKPTLPRETLKICHPWQQPYISWGSLCYVSSRESGCSLSFDLFTFIFSEKAAEYLVLSVLQI